MATPSVEPYMKWFGLCLGMSIPLVEVSLSGDSVFLAACLPKLLTSISSVSVAGHQVNTGLRVPSYRY